MKKIALINDLSGFGKCSLAAAIPVISILGIQACPLPTAILSAQTGFPSYFYDDYTEKMNCFTDEWAKLQVRFDGIYSGFLGSAAQMHNVLYFSRNSRPRIRSIWPTRLWETMGSAYASLRRSCWTV